MKNSLKKVDIWLEAKLDYKFNTGYYSYYLNYKRAVIKRVGSIKATSYQSTLLVALYDALQHILEPCSLTIYSKIELGFSKISKCGNRKLLYEVMEYIHKSNHMFNIVITQDYGIVDLWEQVYGTTKTGEQSEKSECTKSTEITPNDVFNTSKDWRDMYNDLDDGSTWVPGSGGY